ncbi:MAG: phosphoribosylamine--glycine ligase [Euryarchaeota archaeon]|nr:phosphoribosylamine--glycine ligase [Euryarchaeota archaeon]
MGKNVLVIGSGGREHSIALGLAKSEKVSEIHIAPGNAGTLMVGTNHNIDILKNDDVMDLVNRFEIDLVVIGPEAPLVNGLSDRLNHEGILSFGPYSSGAKLEGSKQYAKDVMLKLNIPTASSIIVNDMMHAEEIIDSFGPTWVIKRDVLAGGKGVIVTNDRKEAMDAISEGINLDGFVLIEEFLHGEEASMLVVIDESGFVCLPASQDHKRVGDGDSGPNTGGMGAYAPAPIVTDSVKNKVINRIIMPMHNWLSNQDEHYRGCLYVGLMIDDQGDPYVVEYNVRFGDPETQVTLPLISSDLFDLFSFTAEGRVDELDVTFYEKHALTVVLASEGYPLKPQINRLIGGLDSNSKDVMVHHAGTKLNENGQLVSNGGRVLSITGISDSLSESAKLSYSLINKITLNGSHFRKDIGFRTL